MHDMHICLKTELGNWEEILNSNYVASSSHYPCFHLFYNMSPSKSECWKYFIRTNEGGKCNICQKFIKTSGNTTNLRFHLSRIHKLQFEMKRNKIDTDTDITDTTKSSSSVKQRKVMQQDETDIDIDIDNDIDDLIEKSISSPGSPALSITSVLSSQSQSETSMSLPVVRKRQSTLDLIFQNQKSFHGGGTKAAEYTNNLIFMIAKDNLPLATVEKEGFQIFMKTVAPLYKIPSRKKLRR